MWTYSEQSLKTKIEVVIKLLLFYHPTTNLFNLFRKYKSNQAYLSMPKIPRDKKLRKEGHEFLASLGYMQKKERENERKWEWERST